MSDTPRISDLLLERYLLGDLEQDKRARIEAALSTDPALQQRLAELRANDAAVLAEAPAEAFAHMVAARVAAKRPAVTPWWKRAWLPTLVSATAACALLVVLVKTTSREVIAPTPGAVSVTDQVVPAPVTQAAPEADAQRETERDTPVAQPAAAKPTPGEPGRDQAPVAKRKESREEAKAAQQPTDEGSVFGRFVGAAGGGRAEPPAGSGLAGLGMKGTGAGGGGTGSGAGLGSLGANGGSYGAGRGSVSGKGQALVGDSLATAKPAKAAVADAPSKDTAQSASLSKKAADKSEEVAARDAPPSAPTSVAPPPAPRAVKADDERQSEDSAAVPEPTPANADEFALARTPTLKAGEFLRGGDTLRYSVPQEHVLIVGCRAKEAPMVYVGAEARSLKQPRGTFKLHATTAKTTEHVYVVSASSPFDLGSALQQLRVACIEGHAPTRLATPQTQRHMVLELR